MIPSAGDMARIRFSVFRNDHAGACVSIWSRAAHRVGLIWEKIWKHFLLRDEPVLADEKRSAGMAKEGKKTKKTESAKPAKAAKKTAASTKSKKPPEKSAVKEPEKKTSSKKAASKTAPKKKAEPKKATKKTSAAKKPAEKKAAAKKDATKKTAPKKAVVKKAAAKKAAPKKATAKKDAPKKTAPKKATAKKDAPKKTAAKKPAIKKATTKKATTKKATSMTSEKKTAKTEPKPKAKAEKATTKKPATKAAKKPAATKKAAVKSVEPARTLTLTEGRAAPDFRLPASTGVAIRLKDFQKDKVVVLYFYPKDDTPGCTKEAKDFQNLKMRFMRNGAVVLGISPNDTKSHQKFSKKYSLSIPLLADEGAKISTKYGVWKERSLYGRKFMGIERTTIVIGTDGKIKKIYPKVKVDGHAVAVLEFVKSLKKSKK